MRNTSYDALVSILSLLPMKDFVRMTAAKSAVRLTIHNQWVNKGYGHSRILGEYKLVRNLNSDSRISTLRFDKNFEVVIPERDEWITGNPVGDFDIAVFTDGSKSENGCGSGFHIANTETKLSFKLSDNATVFQSEIFAIMRACLHVKTAYRTRKKIVFCVDSQAALKSLSSLYFKSNLVLQCLDELIAIGQIHEVSLMWVPGHMDIEGNELADTLAKHGAELPATEVITINPSISFYNLKITDFACSKNNRNWDRSGTNLRLREIGLKSDHGLTKKLLSLPRKSVRRFVHAVTGQWCLGNFALKIGKSPVKNCICGLEAAELTRKHFWCDCPMLTSKRSRFLGNYSFNELSEIRDINWLKKLAFVQSSAEFFPLEFY